MQWENNMDGSFISASDKMILDLVMSCVQRLYEKDCILFDRNEGAGVSERCLVFRFAHYLQMSLRDDFYVDCDYNSSFECEYDNDGKLSCRDRKGKWIPLPDGTEKRRFVDIIVHRREESDDTDFMCFEFKKWSNSNASSRLKDLNNLRVLTKIYGYRFGFFIILGRELYDTKWSIFRKGEQEFNTEKMFQKKMQATK